MLDVKRLRILREVAQQGSFSAAADTLHLTQSAVSQQIAALEREAGATLVDRNRGNLRLTDPGEALLGHTEAVIARLDEAERELQEIAGLRSGRVRMVSFPTAGATIAVKAVTAFSKRHPEIALELTEAEPEISIPELRAGDHDIALAYDYDQVPMDEERDVERHLLLEERMQIALPAGHPAAKGRSVNLADLSEASWTVGTCAGTCRDSAVLACRRAGFTPNIGFESDDYQVHISLVSAGIAVSLVPELLLSTNHPDVKVLEISPGAPTRRVWALTRRAEARGPATDAMVEVLKSESKRFVRSRRA
jgi:molybdate transport repressor ModE-like protein